MREPLAAEEVADVGYGVSGRGWWVAGVGWWCRVVGVTGPWDKGGSGGQSKRSFAPAATAQSLVASLRRFHLLAQFCDDLPGHKAG